jgi:hypothetical protein
MPGSNDGKRNYKHKQQRQEELIRSAKGQQDVTSWTQYFGNKVSPVTGLVSTSGSIKHAGLHTFAKVVVIGGTGTFLALFAGPIIGPIVAGGGALLTWLGVKDQLVDYGSAVIEDWIKAGGELLISGGEYVKDKVTGGPQLSSTETQKAGLETQMTEMLASVGLLATLMRESELLQNAPCTYCDDAYARARVIERIEQEMVKVKAKVGVLKAKLDELKVFVDGSLSTDVNSRKLQVKQTVLDTVKAGGAAHFENNWGSYMSLGTIDPRYRFTHCSEAHCFGPGTSGTD